MNGRLTEVLGKKENRKPDGGNKSVTNSEFSGQKVQKIKRLEKNRGGLCPGVGGILA